MEINLKNAMESNKRQIFAVIGIIEDREGRILLQKRVEPTIPEADGKWEFPGGAIEYGESPEDALVRECMEETGCEIMVKRLLPMIQSPIWETTAGEERHVLVVCFVAEYVSGTPTRGDEKVSEIRWFGKEEIAGLDTLKGIKEFLELKDEVESRGTI